MRRSTVELSVLDSPAFGRLNKRLEAEGIENPAELLYHVMEDFVDCEVFHRRAERATKLGLPHGIHDEKKAMMRNSQGLRRLRSAKGHLKKLLANLPPGLARRLPDAEMSELLDEHEMMVRDQLVDHDLTAVEIEELWEIYEDVKQTARAHGARGLIEYVAAKLDALEPLRVDLDKGRAHGSPFPVWKAVAIGFLVGVNIFIFISCFTYLDCSSAWLLIPLDLKFVAQCILAAC